MASGELNAFNVNWLSLNNIKNTIEPTRLDSMKKIHSIMREILSQIRSKEDNCVGGHDSLVFRARWSMVDRIFNL